MGELACQIAQAPEKKRQILQDWLQQEIMDRFEKRILPIDLQIGSIWGNMNARATAKGISLSISDALIAATAMKHDLILVTQNAKRFKPTNARLFNPLKDLQ
jgi:predicted nucleic acid-binding protein